MGTTVRINTDTRDLDEADRQWVADMIDRRATENSVPCVEVAIHVNALRLRLFSGNCAARGGPGRAPTREEQEFFDLWRKHHLDGTDVSHGNLWAFLQQLRHRLERPMH